MSALPLLLGHRGARASRLVPENSLASFDIALEHGCDGFEFDVRWASDDRAVICHDEKINGITVSKATAKQLTDLAVLEDVLRRYHRRAFLDIELKVAGLESKILTALREYPPERGFVVSSFLPHVLVELRIRSATVPLGFLCDRPKQLSGWREFDAEYIIPEYPLITRSFVQEVHTRGKKLFAWTVNYAGAMLELAEWGVDGIISDDTELLVKTFNTSK